MEIIIIQKIKNRSKTKRIFVFVMFSASTLISALQLVSYAKVARLMNPDIPPGKSSSHRHFEMRHRFFEALQKPREMFSRDSICIFL